MIDSLGFYKNVIRNEKGDVQFHHRRGEKRSIMFADHDDAARQKTDSFSR